VVIVHQGYRLARGRCCVDTWLEAAFHFPREVWSGVVHSVLYCVLSSWFSLVTGFSSLWLAGSGSQHFSPPSCELLAERARKHGLDELIQEDTEDHVAESGIDDALPSFDKFCVQICLYLNHLKYLCCQLYVLL